MATLEPLVKKMGEDDVLVGHSLGARAILQVLARIKQRVGHVYLVAPAIWSTTPDWEAVKKDKYWEGSDVDTFAEFHNHPFSWENASEYVDRKTIIFSPNDPYIPVQDHSTIPAGWYIKTMSGSYGHFDQKEYSELLDMISQSKSTGWIPVPDDQLPVKLPEVAAYEPTDTGESPLAQIKDWVNTTCPRCGGKATRETDTMPNWAGSSWYFLRYCDPNNKEIFAAPEKLKYWMPVDLYNGGMEHTTLHLLYSRFWHKFLFDLGYIPVECGSEPYSRRRSHAMILGEGGVKMSKSKGNVINPDDVVKEYGADVFRTYEMFMGPYDQDTPWDTNGILGVKRFLDKVWGVFDRETLNVNRKTSHDPRSTIHDIETLYHQTVKKISEGIEALQFNTCVSQLMILTNAFQEAGGIDAHYREGYLQLLAPFAPHLAEELWHMIGHKDTIHRAGWPKFDPSKLTADTFDLVIQINGKVRDRITVASDISEEEAKQTALASEKVQKWLEGKEPQKMVYVKGKLMSIVV